MSDAVIVLAKEPVPGRVKTRLSPAFTPGEAAQLASAALVDTFTAVRASAAPVKVLAWDGDPDDWRAGFALVRQPSDDLAGRLEAAFADTFDQVLAEGRPDDGALLIGMDTPQVVPGLLDVDWDGADALLGLSEDGGFWAIGLRRSRPAEIFRGIPMSTPRTGAAQLARLIGHGLTVRLLPPLLDVDTPAAAEQVAYTFPQLVFSRTHARLVASRPEQECERLFDRAYARAGVAVNDGGGDRNALALEVDRWSAEADEVDALVMARCQAPVLDLGCGPGRMVRGLTERGQAALGVDISAVAVAISLAGGGPALRRAVGQRLPAEGRWGTALLMDGNIGIGGDVVRLLGRCRSLVVRGGLVLCEVDPDPDRHDIQNVVLRSGNAASRPLPWARIGSRTLLALAAGHDLTVEEEWSGGGRSFVSLRSRR